MTTMGWIILGVMGFVLIAIAIIAFVCFRMAFYSKKRRPLAEDEFDIPSGEAYAPFHDQMEMWVRQMRAMPHENVSITSYDGLTLRGQYFECDPNAPIELMFHGYRSHAERDMSGGAQRCFKLGHNALIVNQRASGDSDGSVITFGIREHRDCLSWIAFVRKRFGENVKIILTGISMGAATVLTAAGQPLPDNVVGVLADCGFTSPREIIRKVIRQMGLPVTPAYWFVRLGGKLYGGFDIEETSPLEAMTRCTVPVIFFHGEEDGYVPCEMSRRNYEACASHSKRLVTIPHTDHGLCCVIDPERYYRELEAFFGNI